MTIALALTALLLAPGADTTPQPAALRWACQVTGANGAMRPFNGYWLGGKKSFPEPKVPGPPRPELSLSGLPTRKNAEITKAADPRFLGRYHMAVIASGDMRSDYLLWLELPNAEKFLVRFSVNSYDQPGYVVIEKQVSLDNDTFGGGDRKYATVGMGFCSFESDTPGEQ